MNAYYHVITGTARRHTSFATFATKALAIEEARRWNECYQTDEYRVLEINGTTRRIVSEDEDSFVRGTLWGA